MTPDRKKAVAEILGPLTSGKKGKEAQADAFQAICDELLEALHGKDAGGVASALRAAFQELESEPHREGPHVEAAEPSEE